MEEIMKMESRKAGLGGLTLVVLVFTFLSVDARLFAQNAQIQNKPESVPDIANDALHQGMYYAIPAYLYGPNSTLGMQLGYQLDKLHFRLDASFVTDDDHGDVVLFANPSVGIFYSEDWAPKVRTYQGISLGIQKGMLNSFSGLSYFLNALTGVEWFALDQKAIYLEIGTGIAFPSIEDSFKGGTIIGGGIKCFF